MRTIKYTAQFKRDYKREKRGQHRVYLDDNLLTVVRLLTTDTPPTRATARSLSDW